MVGMAYWWSNCIQLRWMLWAMCHGGGMGDEGGNDAEATGDEFGWVMQVSTPAGQWPHLPFGCLWCLVLVCCVKVVQRMQGPGLAACVGPCSCDMPCRAAAWCRMSRRPPVLDSTRCAPCPAPPALVACLQHLQDQCLDCLCPCLSRLCSACRGAYDSCIAAQVPVLCLADQRMCRLMLWHTLGPGVLPSLHAEAGQEVLARLWCLWTLGGCMRSPV